METILPADWFYDARNPGAHIESPVELLAGLRRTLNVQFDQTVAHLYKTLAETVSSAEHVFDKSKIVTART